MPGWHRSLSNILAPEFMILQPSLHAILQDVEPGQPVRAQLAATMSGIKQISQKMKGKAFVIETKFDGIARLQTSIKQSKPKPDLCLFNQAPQNVWVTRFDAFHELSSNNS